MVVARTSSADETEIRAGGSGAIAVAQTKIKSTTPVEKTIRLLDPRICKARLAIIYALSSSLTELDLNCERALAYAGIGRNQLNIAC